MIPETEGFSVWAASICCFITNLMFLFYVYLSLFGFLFVAFFFFFLVFDKKKMQKRQISTGDGEWFG